MGETSNKTIIINSVILYVKLVISALCGLLATRFALRALGVVDFGLFSVLSSVISFIAVFNTIMLSTSNRFIAVSIGRGDVTEINEQFNINLVIHIAIAILTFVLAISFGYFYIVNYINFDGDINNALYVFYITIIGSVISFIGVPYNGLLMAKEKFIVFCLVDVISHILKVVVSYLLIYYCSNKLLIYALALALFTAYPTLVYAIYCRKKYPEIVRIVIVRDKDKYKRVLSFSAWVAYGAVASIGKNQGAALIVNTFFNTIMNAALGIANSVLAIIHTFANSITQPIAPQITKSYASNDKNRCDKLLVASTKLSFFVILFVSTPFLIDCEWILELWLGTVPPYSVAFIQLLIIDSLISAFNSGVSTIVFASGKIQLYQVLINTLKFMAIIVAYFVLKFSGPVYALFYTYIIFSVLVAIAGQVVIHITLHFNNWILIKGSYFPSLIITALFLPLLIIDINIYPLMRIALALSYLACVEFYFGFNKHERSVILKKAKMLTQKIIK